MRVEFVPAEPEHVRYLMAHLRERERAAYEKLRGPEFRRIVEQEIADSVLASAALIDGKCCALWGVKPASLLSDAGILWMLGTQVIDQHPIAFLRHSRRALLSLRGSFSRIDGCVLTDYAQSRRWLEWLGFTIGPDQAGISYCEYRFR